MVCKGICVRHKAMKPIGIGRYSTGQKRCQICEIFLKWDGLTIGKNRSYLPRQLIFV